MLNHIPSGTNPIEALGDRPPDDEQPPDPTEIF
jgi:hypothetical protein